MPDPLFQTTLVYCTYDHGTGRGRKILSSNQLVKVAEDQVLYKEKQVQVKEAKAICFLLTDNQNMYIFLLIQLRGGDNMGRDEYTITTTSALDLIIRIEGVIWRNQQSSIYENCGGRGEC